MAGAPDFSAILAGFAQSGLTQADLARHLQVDRSTVWRMINGETRMPTLQTANRIVDLQAKSLISLLRTCNKNGCK